MYAPPGPPPPASKGFPKWLIVIAAIGIFFFVLIPIFSVLAVYGVRKYLQNAKNAEARAVLVQIGQDAQEAYERDHVLCASASSPVPATVASVQGQKYQSARGDWDADRARNAGFACLRFSLDAPQYYQYSYVASRGGEFQVIARGDLDGDGHTSTFILRGKVVAGTLTIEPTIAETDPGE